MTRTSSYKFLKYYPHELLEPLGKIEISCQLLSETRSDALWFSLAPAFIK